MEGVPTSRHPLLRRVPQPHVGADRPAGQDTTTPRLHNVYSGNYRASTILNVNVWGLKEAQDSLSHADVRAPRLSV